MPSANQSIPLCVAHVGRPHSYLFSVKTLSLVILITLGTFTSNATDWIRVHELTIQGINRLYDLEIEAAKSAFDSVSMIAPGDPRGPFFQSMLSFYLYGLNRDEKDLSDFFEESERVIAICENLLDQNGRDATTKFYLGGIYGYRGLAFQTSGSILKAARDGRKGYLLLEEAVRDDPHLYDAQMGFGLFRYLIAKVPRSMSWILTVLGLDGDLEGGLHSLRLAAQKGVYTQAEAKLYLAQFMFAEGRRDTAIQYLNELREKYPENTLFLILYAFWQHRLDNLDEAMAAARKAVELNERKKIKYGEELAYSTMGSIYFSMNDFANARDSYRRYMNMRHNEQATPNWTYYRAGLACEIGGDRAAAVQFFRRTREEKSRPWDLFYYRRAQQLVNRPMTEAEVLLVNGENESSRKKYNRSIELFNEAFQKSGGTVDVQMRTLYGIQQAQFELEMFAEAVETSNHLLALKPVDEAWIVPHAWFKLGQIQAKFGRVADARRAFEKVKEYDDYDFQDRLEARVKEEMGKLGPAQ